MNFAMEKRKRAHRGKEEKEGGPWGWENLGQGGEMGYAHEQTLIKVFPYLPWALGKIVFNVQLFFFPFYLSPNFQ